MRLHINMDDELVSELDRRIGSRQRSEFIRQLIRRALDDQARWDQIVNVLSLVADKGHEWDDDPARWVSEQRHGEGTRVG